MNKTRLSRLSRLRKNLVQLRRDEAKLVKIFTARMSLVKGSVYEHQRTCGKPSCVCVREGKPHTSTVLSFSEGGKTRYRALSDQEAGALKTMTENYQKFRRARARIVKVHQKMIGIIDRIEKERRTE